MKFSMNKLCSFLEYAKGEKKLKRKTAAAAAAATHHAMIFSVAHRVLRARISDIGNGFTGWKVVGSSTTTISTR